MACSIRCNESTDNLQAAVSAVKNDKVSLSIVEGVYDDPKSTIAFVHGKAINKDLRPFSLLPKKQGVAFKV